jgi:hypothetical protein
MKFDISIPFRSDQICTTTNQQWDTSLLMQTVQTRVFQAAIFLI